MKTTNIISVILIGILSLQQPAQLVAQKTADKAGSSAAVKVKKSELDKALDEVEQAEKKPKKKWGLGWKIFGGVVLAYIAYTGYQLSTMDWKQVLLGNNDQNYYAALELPEFIPSAKQITEAWDKIQAQFPDLEPDDALAPPRLKDAYEAYQVLSQPRKRKGYDAKFQQTIWNNGFVIPPYVQSKAVEVEINPLKDYYGILGVDKKAPTLEIKRTYRILAPQYHPDKNPGDEVAAEKFKDLGEAYAVLTDSTKRKDYDLKITHGPAYKSKGQSVEASEEETPTQTALEDVD